MAYAFLLHGLSSSGRQRERRWRACGGLGACVVLLAVVAEGVIIIEVGTTCWRWRRCVKKWFRESKYILYTQYAKLDFGAAFKAELKYIFSVLLVIFITGLPNIRHTALIYLFIKSFSSRAAGLYIFMLYKYLYFCLRLYLNYILALFLLFLYSFPFFPLLLYINITAVLAERAEPISLS